MTKHSTLHPSPGQGAPSVDPQRAWQVALGELQLQVTADTYEMYLHPTRFVAYEDGTFIVAVPNAFVKDWLEMRLNRVVKRTLQHIVNRAVEIKYTVRPPAVRDADQPAPAPLLDFVAADSPSVAAPEGMFDGYPLVADYTFAKFIVGSNNRIAHAASLAVADQPGSRYNPLFLYSGVGLGKTHLLHAIGHRVRQQGYKATYVPCEAFTNEFITAIRLGATEQFRAKYRTADVLLLDDVQFLASKTSTQEELFYTFNALHEAGRQVILASDRPPKAISALESRLRSRFEWGLIADIQPPSLEMRLAILQAKAAEQGAVIPNNVLEKIATLVPTNVRELEGALNKVLAAVSLSDAELTPAMVEMTLADVLPPKAQVEPEVVLVLVARTFGVSPQELIGSSRKKDLVLVRQVAMYLLREVLDLPFARVGDLCGGRDHATAMHSVRKMAELLENDEDLQRKVGRVREQLLTAEPVPLRPRA